MHGGERSEEVRRRARAGPCEFALLIPDVHDRKAADWTLDTALPLLRRASHGHVAGLTGGSDPIASVRDAVGNGNFDEIIVSTLPHGVSKWARRDLISRIRRLGLPVTVIRPGSGPGLSNKEALETMVDLGPSV